jgi:hypothetical protein
VASKVPSSMECWRNQSCSPPYDPNLALEKITNVYPWIELATESVQLAVRLRRAWGAGANDHAALNLESWKIISADANEVVPQLRPKSGRLPRGKKVRPAGHRP